MQTILAALASQLIHLPNNKQLFEQTKQKLTLKNGNQAKWQIALEQIKQIKPGYLTLNSPFIQIKLPQTPKLLIQSLCAFKPWRKGPYQVGNIELDSEWRGDMKWDRITPFIGSLQGKTVLDVGCGNGYFSYRMSLAGADFVLGLEPFLLFNYQFYAIQALLENKPKLAVLPLRLEEIPVNIKFDTVFSMGVLYHQKSPIDHLKQLKQHLTPNGKLILETLVVPGELGYSLLPKDRYAQMRNVWFLPSIATMVSYLTRCGYKNIDCVDINQTSTTEQHRSEWLGEDCASLVNFLDPDDLNKTIEGYPAPRRATFVCNI